MYIRPEEKQIYEWGCKGWQERQGEERGKAKKLASESIQLIPIAKETTSQSPVSISALNSCITYNLASVKDFNCWVKKSQSSSVSGKRNYDDVR